MRTEDLRIDDILSFFHHEKPISCSVKEIRCEENDSRYVVFADFPEGKFVIKMASNGFTTEDRVNGWVDLIARYREMGYYSPSLRKSVHNRYTERFEWNGKTFIVWEEEFAKYRFTDQLERKTVNAEGTRYIYHDEVIAFFAKVGQRHLKNTWGKSGWVRLEPFSADENTDEITGCVETFDHLVKERTPHFIGRWRKILRLFEQNREELKKVYHKLPTSVFQADFGDPNLLVDDSGHFQGVIDYNLAGEDTVLNMAVSMGLFGPPYFKKRDFGSHALPDLNEEAQNYRIEKLLDTLRVFKKYYRFSETEIQAAPMLFKYIFTVEYAHIKAFEEHWQDDRKVNLLFDYMEHELLREDIDFRSALMND